jgi:hypothetical protein
MQSLPNLLIEREYRNNRECFVQHALACLIVGGRPPGSNKAAAPSPRGRKFLNRLDNAAFGRSDWTSEVRFVCEFKLPKALDAAENRWPDFGVYDGRRLMLIELKTEYGSVRRGQLQEQVNLARHHHPERRVDLLYIAPDEAVDERVTCTDGKFATLRWAQVASDVLNVWGAESPTLAEHGYAHLFAEYLQQLEPFQTQRIPSPIRGRRTRAAPTDTATIPKTDRADDTHRVVLAAMRCESSKRQQVADVLWPSEAVAESFLVQARTLIQEHNRLAPSPILHASPWVWTPRQRGSALTDSGRATGVELRFSYYKDGNGIDLLTDKTA